MGMDQPLPLSPHPTYTMMSELENLDNAWLCMFSLVPSSANSSSR